MDQRPASSPQQAIDESSGEKSSGASLLEHGIATIGALLVAASLAFLLYEGLWGDHSSPELQVTVDTITRTGDNYLVAFTVTNQGGRTAAAVRITGSVVQQQLTQQAEVTLDYVPGASKASGGLFFTIDPRHGQLELRATGYQNP